MCRVLYVVAKVLSHNLVKAVRTGKIGSSCVQHLALLCVCSRVLQSCTLAEEEQDPILARHQQNRQKTTPSVDQSSETATIKKLHVSSANLQRVRHADVIATPIATNKTQNTLCGHSSQIIESCMGKRVYKFTFNFERVALRRGSQVDASARTIGWSGCDGSVSSCSRSRRRRRCAPAGRWRRPTTRSHGKCGALAQTYNPLAR